jgi:glycosyltransferase involved in cell wall biosynthesis
MAKKMWIWRDPDLETGEKGVLMQLRIYSYFKWRTKVVKDFDKIKQHYNILMGEHMEVQNPMYQSKFADHYKTYIRDFDLWFHGTTSSRNFIYQKSGERAETVPHMLMPAVCYLINQDYWTPDPTVKKSYDFMICVNDLISYKRPELAIELFGIWRRKVNKKARCALVYSNVFSNMQNVCQRAADRAGNVDFIRSPSPSQIRDLYRRSKFLIHPSRTESGPRVIGEAMSCGTPVIIPNEPWAESVAHLHPGMLVMKKKYFTNEVGPASIQKFDRDLDRSIVPQLVNTRYYLDQIDKKLAETNKVWTLGKLFPPQWVGEHLIAEKSDELFTQVTGEALI